MINCKICLQVKESYSGNRLTCKSCFSKNRRRWYSNLDREKKREKYVKFNQNKERICKWCRYKKELNEFTGGNTVCNNCKIEYSNRTKICLNCKVEKSYNEYESKKRVCMECNEENFNIEIAKEKNFDRWFSDGYRQRIDDFMKQVINDLQEIIYKRK